MQEHSTKWENKLSVLSLQEHMRFGTSFIQNYLFLSFDNEMSRSGGANKMINFELVVRSSSEPASIEEYLKKGFLFHIKFLLIHRAFGSCNCNCDFYRG